MVNETEKRHTEPSDTVTDKHQAHVVEKPPKRRVWNQWRYNPEPDVIENVNNELIFEGERRAPFLNRFFILLTLSVLITSFGLINSSTAVVIAGMLVAPLITPIMAIAVAMVSGQPRRQLNSALLVLVATVISGGLAWLIAIIFPNPAVISAEVLARTQPNLIDLMIAITAGAAGGYSIVRREASSALAGVAIGVSLVPPLASAGLLFGWDESDLAGGALLLYFTNLAAIIFAGSIVFSLVGFLPVSDFGYLPRRVRWSLIGAAIAVAIIAVPLIDHSIEVGRESAQEATVSRVANDWLTGTEFDLLQFEQSGNEVTLSIVGPVDTFGNPPASLDELAANLSQALGEPIDLQLRVFPYTAFERDLRIKGQAQGD